MKIGLKAFFGENRLKIVPSNKQNLKNIDSYS